MREHKCEPAMEHRPLPLNSHLLCLSTEVKSGLLYQHIPGYLHYCTYLMGASPPGYQSLTGRLARTSSREGPGPTAPKMSKYIQMLATSKASQTRACGCAVSLARFRARAGRQKSLNLCRSRRALDEPSRVGPNNGTFVKHARAAGSPAKIDSSRFRAIKDGSAAAHQLNVPQRHATDNVCLLVSSELFAICFGCEALQAAPMDSPARRFAHVEELFEHLACFTDDHTVFWALCLTSRACYRIFRKHLWADIVWDHRSDGFFQNNDNLEKFLSTHAIDLAQTRSLRGIRRVNAGIPPDRDDSSYLAGIERLQQHMPNLKSYE